MPTSGKRFVRAWAACQWAHPSCVLKHTFALARQVFRDFSYTPADNAFRKCFNVNLSNLVNSLSVFSSSDGHANLSLRWPDRDGRLLLQLNALRDADGVGTMVDSCTYAEVSCEECTFAEDLEGELTQARSQFTLQVRVPCGGAYRRWIDGDSPYICVTRARRCVK